MSGKIMDEASSVFMTFQKLPTRNTVNILIVGMEGVGKHQLAKFLTHFDQPYSVHVRTATSLPLPETHRESRPRIDFVAFIVDMTNRKSVNTIEESARNLDINYFVGRACFVATKVWHQQEQGVDEELLTQLASTYDSPVLKTDLQKSDDWQAVAQQILKMASMSAGVSSFVSPLLTNTVSSQQLSL